MVSKDKLYLIHHSALCIHHFLRCSLIESKFASAEGTAATA